MNIINLTPHSITAAGREPILPSGEVARVNARTTQTGDLNGIPIIETKVIGISGVPDAKKDTIYIVPTMVRQLLPDRKDLLSPAKLLRDKSGSVVGCVGFEINP